MTFTFVSSYAISSREDSSFSQSSDRQSIEYQKKKKTVSPHSALIELFCSNLFAGEEGLRNNGRVKVINGPN